MHLLGRLTVTAAVTVALVGLLVFAAPGVFARLGMNVGDLPELLRDLQNARAHGDALDARIAAWTARTSAMNEVVSELIDGKVSLVRATARVRDLFATDPEVWEWLAWDDQGNSDGERRCRRVIAWTQEMLRDTPERAAAVRARLERELDQILRDRGTVVLP